MQIDDSAVWMSLHREAPLGVEVGDTLGASRQPLRGITPMPRHVRSVTSKTSSSIAFAAGLPSAGTARRYWFSTSCRPRLELHDARRMPSRMSSGSKPVTTIGTR